MVLLKLLTAPVVKWISQQSSELFLKVRVLPGAPILHIKIGIERFILAKPKEIFDQNFGVKFIS